MTDAPERIWMTWKQANDNFVAFDEPPQNPDQDGQTEWVRADLIPGMIEEAVKAENEACEQVAWSFDGFGVDVYAWPGHIATAIRARHAGKSRMHELKSRARAFAAKRKGEK